MKVLDIEQGSDIWHARRRCTITGSKLDNVMGTDLARVQQIAELIAEEATEQSKIVRATAEMERGNEEEEFALNLFERQTGKKLVRGGMWVSDENDWHANSPDASIVDENGDITEACEVKNPDTKTVMFYRLTNIVGMEELNLGTWLKPTKDRVEPEFKPSAKNPFIGIPADYKWQCVNYFLVNEKLQKLHFLVHDARIINDDAKLYIVTIDRDNEILQEAMAEAKITLAKFRSDWLKWKEMILPTEF